MIPVFVFVTTAIVLIMVVVLTALHYYSNRRAKPSEAFSEQHLAAVPVSTTGNGTVYMVTTAKYAFKVDAENGQGPPRPAPVPTPTRTPTPAAIKSGAGDPLDVQMTAFFKKWPADGFAKMKPGEKLNVYEVKDPRPSVYKKRIVALCEKLSLPLDLQLLIIAKGMIESQALSVGERDTLKDPGGPMYCGEGCINFGFGNLNTSLIRDVIEANPDLASLGLTEDKIMATGCAATKGEDKGPTATCDPAKSILNQDTEEGYELTLRLVVAGIQLWGVDRYVDYLRGGGSLFQDTTDYSTPEYITAGADKSRLFVAQFKCGLTWICDTIKEDMVLLTDDRRVSLMIQYV